MAMQIAFTVDHVFFFTFEFYEFIYEPIEMDPNRSIRVKCNAMNSIDMEIMHSNRFNP